MYIQFANGVNFIHYSVEVEANYSQINLGLQL